MNWPSNWPSMRTISEPTHWDPFEDICKTQERLNMLFEDFMPMEIWEEENVFSPAVDIKDEGKNLLVTTNLPGINREDIELNLKEGMLEISAKSGKEEETEDEGCIRKEKNTLTFPEVFSCLSTLKRRIALQKLKMVF